MESFLRYSRMDSTLSTYPKNDVYNILHHYVNFILYRNASRFQHPESCLHRENDETGGEDPICVLHTEIVHARDDIAGVARRPEVL